LGGEGQRREKGRERREVRGRIRGRVVLKKNYFLMRAV